MNGFRIGRPLRRSLTSPLPVANRLHVEASLGVVVCQEFWLDFYGLREPRDQYLGNSLMIVLSSTP